MWFCSCFIISGIRNNHLLVFHRTLKNRFRYTVIKYCARSCLKHVIVSYDKKNQKSGLPGNPIISTIEQINSTIVLMSGVSSGRWLYQTKNHVKSTKLFHRFFLSYNNYKNIVNKYDNINNIDFILLAFSKFNYI